MNTPENTMIDVNNKLSALLLAANEFAPVQTNSYPSNDHSPDSQSNGKSEKKADLETANALYQLGISHKEGKKGFNIDINKAFSYFQKALAEVNTIIQEKPKAEKPEIYYQIKFQIAALHFLNNHQNYNSEKGVALLHELVAEKHSPAHHMLGTWYAFQGNQIEAIQCWEAGSKLGNLHCKLSLADGYIMGSLGKNEAKALQLFNEMIVQGNMEAQVTLAEHYFLGKHIEVDHRKAFQLFQPIAKKGNMVANAYLGACYLRGWGTPRDTKLAIEHLNIANKGEYAISTILLGICQQRGTGLRKDEAAAVKLFKRAAGVDDDLMGCYLIANCYQFGIGVEQDVKKAYEIIANATHVDNADTRDILFLCHANGVGMPKDLTRAMTYYRAPVEYSPYCIYEETRLEVAKCFLRGEGVPQNFTRALDILLGIQLQGGKLGEDVYNSLTHCYREGFGVEENLESAHEWLLQSVSEGNKNHVFALGANYFHGIGVMQDRKKALEYFKQGAGFSCPQSMNACGVCWAMGVDASKPDYKKAVNCFKEAIAQSKRLAKELQVGPRQVANNATEAEAESNLGWCYLYGLGVDKDLKKAMELFESAAKKGSRVAARNRAWCLMNGFGEKSDPKKAEALFKEAQGVQNAQGAQDVANQGFGFSMGRDYPAVLYIDFEKDQKQKAEMLYNLGYCYSKSLGLKRDYKLAFENFKKSAELGYRTAELRLALCYIIKGSDQDREEGPQNPS